MDEFILRTIVRHATADSGTLAALACTCRLLRRLVAEEWRDRGCCGDLRRLLGATVVDSTGAARAAALLGGSYRRHFLADLAACQSAGRCYDGRRQTLDLLTLPQKCQWLAQVELLVTDMQHVLLYDAGLAPLGALSFVDRPAGAPAGQARPQPRMFFGLLSTLLIKCSLRCGVLCLDPPVGLGAADWLHHRQLAPAEREALAAAAARRYGGSGRQGLGADDDVHLLHHSLLRLGVLERLAVLGGSLAGLLHTSLVHQLATRGRPPTLRLRFLDLSGSAELSDQAAAQLLCMCPQLRVLHAAGCPQLGPALLAALAGRLRQREQSDSEQEGSRHVCHAQEQSHARNPSSCQPRLHPANSSSRGPTAAAAAEEGLRSLQLDSFSVQGRRGAHDAAQAVAADLDGAAPQPACPLLEALNLSGCATKGSALRRSLRCLPRLRSLCLNGCAGVGGLLDPLLKADGGGGSSSSSKAAKAGRVTSVPAALTRLEALDTDLEGRHVQALLRHCTALRSLALSGRQLAAEGFDRRQHSMHAGSESSCGASASSAALPSLIHLEVGWGTGGTFLLHLTQRHCPHLAALTVHVGAAVSDWHMERLASSCPHLGRLCLRRANVSEAGVAAMLCGCSQLTSLQLHSCVGPFGDALAPPGPRPLPFRLRELHISWSASQLSDAGLAALVHPRCAALQELVLQGCSRLTDASWAAIQQQASTLRCLRLEACGALPMWHKGRGGAAQPLTTEGLQATLAACERLLTLTVRSCVDEGDRQQLDWSTTCFSLQSIDLD
ncbi:hypothetical protein ABPG75_012800 [Micractinium tetrahymenae]